ncbi:hypothetical protein BDZ91DRAFT_746680 [Kalaharituber pfeilii]|nr:hypothetical protein BDZ91DRAFT_748052 [Kalaharituber pfeilii]KAF8455451.1 hypothetical protein BDZ91DRAFT_746680 [Kalaharituber pfeilii]
MSCQDTLKTRRITRADVWETTVKALERAGYSEDGVFGNLWKYVMEADHGLGGSPKHGSNLTIWFDDHGDVTRYEAGGPPLPTPPPHSTGSPTQQRGCQ